MTGEAAEALRKQFNLDRPAREAMLLWWGQLLDRGASMVTGRSIWVEIGTQLGHTIRLSFAAFALSIGIVMINSVINLACAAIDPRLNAS